MKAESLSDSASPIDPTSEQARQIVVSFRCPAALLACVDELAAMHGITRSALITASIAELNEQVLQQQCGRLVPPYPRSLPVYFQLTDEDAFE